MIRCYSFKGRITWNFFVTLDTHTQPRWANPTNREKMFAIIIKIYIEDTVDIRRHKEARNSYK